MKARWAARMSVAESPIINAWQGGILKSRKAFEEA